MLKNEVVVVLTSLPSQIVPATTVGLVKLRARRQCREANSSCDDDVARLDNIARLKDSSREEKFVWYANAKDG